MSESPSNSFASCATCDRATDVRALWRKRPRDGFVRFSIWSLTALVTAAWAMGGFSFSNWFSARRLENAKRFISQDAAPHADSVTEWASDLWSRHGAHGLMATLAISVLAIVLAAIWALCLAPLTSRVVMSRDPWVKEGSPRVALRPSSRAFVLHCFACHPRICFGVFAASYFGARCLAGCFGIGFA